MKRIAYLDCNAGISGNMFLGALLDIGLPEAVLSDQLGKLPIVVPKITIAKVKKKGMEATWFDVEEVHEHHHRHLSDILKIIDESQLSSNIKERAVQCFRNLAVAEAKIHGVSVEEIHFHEVGAIDAIIDIVGACIGIEWLKIDEFLVSPIRVGYGTIQCAHGIIPLPAPAAMELLTGYEVYGGDIEGEWVTPTGAALLKTIAKPARSIPKMKIDTMGYGSGTSERPIPNIIRVIIGYIDDEINQDTQVILETNIDDMNPEFYGYLGERLLKEGALDYFYTPVQMKKNRPAILVNVLVSPEKVGEIEKTLFEETTTLGVRKYLVERSCLHRSEITVSVDGLSIRVKTGKLNGKLLKYAPEYEDCRYVAEQLQKPLREVYEMANHEAKKVLSLEESK